MKLPVLFSYSRKHLVYIPLFLALTFIAITFQNCAQGDYDLKAIEDLTMLEADSKFAYINTSRGELPKLKLFFIVDNSYTMEANQVNLADSFGKMFEESSDSLSQFDLEVFITSTSQLIPSDSDLSSSQLLKLEDIKSGSLLGFEANRWQSGLLTGKIPGDLVGVNITSNQSSLANDANQKLKFQILPAMISIPIEKSGGGLELLNKIEIKKGTPVAQIKSLFNQRLEILKPSLYKDNVVNNANLSLQKGIVERESGLCALGRILKHKENLYENGDLLSFVLVSDENDSIGVNNYKCVDSREKNITNLYNVECAKPQTNFVARRENKTPRTQLTYTQNSSASCKINKAIGFRATATVTTAGATTSTSYNLSYKVKVCDTIDGSQFCQWKNETKTVNGPLTGDFTSPATFGLLPTANYEIITVVTQTTQIPATTAVISKDYTFSNTLTVAPNDCNNLDLFTSKGYSLSQMVAGTCSITLRNQTYTFSSGQTIGNINFDGSAASCDSGVPSLCSSSLLSSSYCSKNAYTPAGVSTSKVIFNGDFTCDSTCSNIAQNNTLNSSSICFGGSSSSIVSWLSSNRSSLSCTATKLADSVSYSPYNLTVDGSLTCDSKCSGSQCAGQSQLTFREYFNSINYGYDCNTTASEHKTTVNNVTSTEIMNQCSNGYNYKSHTIASTQTTYQDELVSGSENMNTYISGKFSSLKPFLTVFTHQDGETISNGASIGTAYNNLADQLGGQKFSITLNSYAPALKDLGQVIKERMYKSYKVAELDPEGGVILRIFQKSGKANSLSEEVPKSKWTQTGNTVIFAQDLLINEGDIFTIEYKNPKYVYSNN